MKTIINFGRLALLLWCGYRAYQFFGPPAQSPSKVAHEMAAELSTDMRGAQDWFGDLIDKTLEEDA